MIEKLFKIFKVSFFAIGVLLVIIFWSALSYFGIFYAKEYLASESVAGEGCNVAGINLRGDVVTYHSNDSFNDQGGLIFDQTSADEVMRVMRETQADDSIKAVMVEIDSAGGSPVGGEEIMKALKDSPKPVVAYIRNVGASSAYLAATGADTIFASRFSDVGSIGMTMSYLQETERDKKAGLTYIDLSSGKYKDSGNPSRPLSTEEKQLFMRDIRIGHEHFVKMVAENRRLDIAKVRGLADGSSLTGEFAKKAGLIDEIGTSSDVKKFLSEKIGEPVDICWQN